MTNEVRKGILVFGVGFLLFWMLRDNRLFNSNSSSSKSGSGSGSGGRDKLTMPVFDQKQVNASQAGKNAYIAMKAFVDAYNAGEENKALEELKAEVAKTLKVKLQFRSSDKKIIISDLSGNVIIMQN